MNQVWDSILDIASKLVIPDWGALIALIPVALLVLAVAYAVWVVHRFATVGPARTGRGRLRPVPPPDVHLPGGSLAPIFAAIGMFALFLGLVVGGTWLVIGAVGLSLSLLWWGREGLREYDHVAGVQRLPAVIPGDPPPGVHLPGPSFRPVMASIAMAILFFGLVVGGWLLVAGLIVLVISLLGWLRDARYEYGAVVAADRTGHIDNGPAPTFPTGTLVLFALIVAFAGALNAGVLPPPPAATADGGGGGGAPVVTPVAADVTLTASNFQWVNPDLEAPADTVFSWAIVNEDAAGNHDVVLSDATDTEVFRSGAPFSGPKTEVVQAGPFAAGAYPFVCSVHANMKGTLTVK